MKKRHICGVIMMFLGVVGAIAGIVLHYLAGAPSTGYWPSIIIQCISTASTIVGAFIAQENIATETEG